MYFSKHFMTIEVRATGLKSLFSDGQGFLAIGIMTEFFQTADTVCRSTDCWKMGHHVGVSSSAHAFKSSAEIPSGPVDFFSTHLFENQLNLVWVNNNPIAWIS